MAVQPPTWKNLKGMRRVQAEFKHLSADIAAKKFDFVKELLLVDDNLLVWQLKLHNFDNDLAGGRQLNQDLCRLQAMYGQDHILMQIEFPRDYPHQPFFVRLVSPRCQMYTGHVTAGGSVCLEALTCSGTAGSWQPDFSVESLLNVIVINMIDCPVTLVQTATGPGGRSGPLRIDFTHGNPTRGYSSAEARQAFHRTLENHKRMGWGGSGNMAAPSAPAAAAAAGAGPSAAATRVAAAAAGVSVHSTPPVNNHSSAAAAGSVGPEEGAGTAAAEHMANTRRQRSKRRKDATKAAVVAAPAASAACDMIDLVSCSADDDSEAELAVALKLSLQETNSEQQQPAVAAAAARSKQRRTKMPTVPQAGGRQQPRQQSDSTGAAAAGNSRRQAALRQQQQQLVCLYLDSEDNDDDDDVDDDFDDDVTVIYSQQAARQRRARRAAAAAPATNGNSAKRVASITATSIAAAGTAGAKTASRKRTRQLDDVIVIGSQGEDDDAVYLTGDGRAHTAAATAAATAPAGSSRPYRLAAQQAQQQMQQRPAAQQQAQSKRDTAQPKQRQQQHSGGAVLAVQPVVQHHVEGDGAAPRMQLELGYPANWDFSHPIQSNTVRLVELPLNGQPGLTAPTCTDPLEAAAAQYDQSIVDMLVSQGVNRRDALAALVMADGDADEALVCAATFAMFGGPAKLWQDAPPLDISQQNRQQEQARCIAEEVESVLALIDATGRGVVNQSKVLKLERVQHARLWKRYCLKRSELQESCGEAGVNERLLFHGTSPGTADQIAQSGFDFRLVSYSSAYGNGLYFADHSSTAWGYCSKPDTAAAATGMAHIGGWAPPTLPTLPTSGMPGTGMLPSWGTAMGSAPGNAAAPNAAAAVTRGRGSKRGRGAGAPSTRAAAAGQVQRVYKMIIARVALGRQAQGVQGMRKPPDGYDSVNSGSAAVPGQAQHARAGQLVPGQQLYYCHVVFDNDQCFPEYVVTLRP